MSICVNAQIDTTFIQPDTLSPTTYEEPQVENSKKKFRLRDREKPETPLLKRIMQPEKHSSLSAVAYSLALPGAGQIYNKKYWKLPIVYGGLGWMGYRIHRTTQTHRLFRDAYIARIDDDPSTQDTRFILFTDANVNSRRLESKRQQELAIIGFGVVYILVAVDAFVDAHLWSFDINDDLSMEVSPALIAPVNQQATSLGISLQLHAKTPSAPTALFILTE